MGLSIYNSLSIEVMPLFIIISHSFFFPHQNKTEYYGHHAKPVSLAWSPDNEHFATGGMDMMVYVWTVGDADKRIKIPGRPIVHMCIHTCPACTQVRIDVLESCSVRATHVHFATKTKHAATRYH